jgi:EAL domain-containing protein (putative c-di-GMP-specific phosphodiesterase class I)
MQNPDEAVKIMTALRAMGSTLAIDDFGTGYSSLSALKRFPLSRLKIAQMFIHDIPADTDSVAIAHAVISLGGSMKLRVIAEGVETAEQYQFLQASGCDEIQGYWASKPVPAEQIPQLLARNFGHASAPAS